MVTSFLLREFLCLTTCATKAVDGVIQCRDLLKVKYIFLCNVSQQWT